MPSKTAAPIKTKQMADQLNVARALRVTEIMRDYQNIQHSIAQYQANPTQDEYHEVGYSALRQCHADARALLNVQYPVELLHPPTGPNETEKRQLQRVIVDGSARRFQAQKIHLRATAAVKWINRRNAILQGRKPQNGNIALLQQADNDLRNDIAAITNERIVNGFRTVDQQAGYWLQDDPSTQTILSWIRSHH
ncbi:hypothetical protein MMC28_001105 [Mycoblastus sanguinarius]|nr:hypothetical protein [Mycoblastus sanguinarius]